MFDPEIIKTFSKPTPEPTGCDQLRKRNLRHKRYRDWVGSQPDRDTPNKKDKTDDTSR